MKIIYCLIIAIACISMANAQVGNPPKCIFPTPIKREEIKAFEVAPMPRVKLHDGERLGLGAGGPAPPKLLEPKWIGGQKLGEIAPMPRVVKEPWKCVFPTKKN